MSDVYQNIIDGKYANKVPWPELPMKPPPIGSLEFVTDDQFKEHQKELTAHRVAELRHKELVTAYYVGESEAISLFWEDVRIESDIPEGETFFDLMASLAWERGHSAGFSEVFSEFNDLLPFWEAYRDKGKT